MRRITFASCWMISLALSCPASAEDVDYLKDVKPLLERKCFACHSAVRQSSELRLDAAVLIRKGGASGPAIVSGKANESLLIHRVTATHGEELMPPEGEGTALKKDEVALISSWINLGAPAPDDEAITPNPKDFWSFKPPERPAVPTVKNSAWIRTPIDAFIAAQHEARGLSPNPPAEKAILLRRASLDLIGLPPSPDALEQFLNDKRPDAYGRAVDRLLESPQYGERWGRHWMDVWRYSDWHGSGTEIRYGQRHLWRWRDWIVNSLNSDKGYDRMIVEMLAADEVDPTNPENLPATGFIGRNWYKFDRNVWMRELVEHTAMGFMAVTLKCARCHDHKFDPIAQEEYYRFRAFFEPHDVRVDRISWASGTDKDAKLGDVLADGIPRVFDKSLDVPTYLFQRGDDRYPDETKPLQPGVLESLPGPNLSVSPVELPRAAYLPFLQPHLLEELETIAEQKVARSRDELRLAEIRLSAAQSQLEEYLKEPAGSRKARQLENVVFEDDFSQPRPELWKPVTGKWEHQEGQLVQSGIGPFLTMVSQVEHPQDFIARVRYTSTDVGVIHSIGVGFDVVGTDSMQAIYTWIPKGRSGISAFHRENGKEDYPKSSLVPLPLKLNEEITLDFAARGSLLNVWVNGELVIVHEMPMARRRGFFSLWNHSGTSRYSEVRVAALPPELSLATQVSQGSQSPFVAASRESLETRVEEAKRSLLVSQKHVEVAKAEYKEATRRILAEQSKYAEPPDEAQFTEAGKQAAAAKRQAAFAKADLASLQSQQAVDVIEASLPEEKRADDEPLAAAKKKLAAAVNALEAARKALDVEDGKYTPLGEPYPKTSSGRRTALARWLADRANPRTSRVAVNHIWMRHFGRAIVDSVADFGMRAKPRTHPQLLDWLAMEFADNNWSMKHIHRLIMTSNAYRMSSLPSDGTVNLAIDPENRGLWRMNWRRMEAEIVRDSVLSVAGLLDETRGGPSLPASEGQSSRRRSMYFQFAPNRQMEFLTLFDTANPEECYERKPSVIPQQSLALMNSAIALASSRQLARTLEQELGDGENKQEFIEVLFRRVLSRTASDKEFDFCLRFLATQETLLADQTSLSRFSGSSGAAIAPSRTPRLRARENLVHVLFNHNDFLTIR